MSPRSADLPFIRPHTEQCEHPAKYPGEPDTYAEWFDWATEMEKTYEQLFCQHCRRWALWRSRTRFPRGRCPVCQRMISMRKDGTLRDHQNLQGGLMTTASGRSTHPHCPGSGGTP